MKSCNYCRRPFTNEELEIKRLAKIENARASARKAKENGTHVGPRQQRDDQKIKELRNKGFTIRQIAAMVGFSASTVQNALNYMENNPTPKKAGTP